MRKTQYNGARKLFFRYWNAYGGWSAVVSSPYFHLSVLISFVSYGFWIDNNWVDTPISVLPNIIGFSLGGYAIWLALGDEKFRTAISGRTQDEKESPFIIVNATFVHFIVLQIIALLYALVAKSQPIENSPVAIQSFFLNLAPWLNEVSKWLSFATNFFGFMLFIYAILSALAAVMAVFRIAGWLDSYQDKKGKEDQETQS